MNTTLVLALVPLFLVVAHSFPWDIVVAREKRLDFVYNGAVTHSEDIQSADHITAVTYDPVHFRVLFFDHHSTNMSIHSYDLTTKKMQTIVTRPLNNYYKNLAYDPVTQLLFWSEDSKIIIYSLSLKPASSNKVDLLVTSDDYCGGIAVDSCGGFIYWTTRYNIERAAFDGSKREVLINDQLIYSRRMLAIDQEKEKLYWIDETMYNQFSIESADLSGRNRRTLYHIGDEEVATALTVSKDFVYWWSYSQEVILQIPKHQQHGVAPVVYTQATLGKCGACQRTAANYTIEEQTLGIKSCEALKSVIPDVEERHGSICHNYCFQGNCSLSAEGHPKCSCNRGYSGERCEVDACHKHCFNDGVCSLTEADKPVCQCTADYQGERCDVSICKDFCLHGNCSVSAEGQRTCSCNRGYSGERCEVDACHKHCFNDGVCSLTEADKPSFTLIIRCALGTADYQGERCDVSICKDYCLHGNCSVSAEGQRTCSCYHGYSGERCDVSICKDYCLQGNCSIATEGQPTCSCNRGYSGERCELNACHKHCFNNGVCSLNEAEKPVCQCTADYQGERCDVSICKDYCLQGNCSFSTEGKRTCSCEAGYSGERCEVNACYKHCLHGGVCSLNEEEEPFCQCGADYEGERCDVATTQTGATGTTGACVCADQTTQQILLEVKQVREDLQCTLQLYSDKLDENAAKIQICEELMNDDQQNHKETTSKTQTSSIHF